MKRYGKMILVGVSSILASAFMLTGCNTVKGTAVGVGQAVEDTAVGAERDINATEKAITPAKKAHHKKAKHRTKAKKKSKSS